MALAIDQTQRSDFLIEPVNHTDRGIHHGDMFEAVQQI